MVDHIPIDGRPLGWLKVTELKAELGKRAQPKHGTKRELATRLGEYILAHPPSENRPRRQPEEPEEEQHNANGSPVKRVAVAVTPAEGDVQDPRQEVCSTNQVRPVAALFKDDDGARTARTEVEAAVILAKLSSSAPSKSDSDSTNNRAASSASAVVVTGSKETESGVEQSITKEPGPQDGHSATAEPSSPELGKGDRKRLPAGRAHRHHLISPECTAKVKPVVVKSKQTTTKITSFFATRKSTRNADLTKKKQEEDGLHQRILDGKDDPRIEVREFPVKGRGIVAREDFKVDEFVVEYNGELITSYAAAKEKEAFYAQHPDQYGSYMYFFKHREKTLCVDATAETGRYGRLLNHSRTAPNLRPEVVEINKKPYIVLRAARHIKAGEELVYDYGDRQPESLAAFPWLKD